MRRILFSTLGLILVLLSNFASAGLAKDETRILERIVSASPVQQYIRPRPEIESEPVDVRLSLFVNSIQKLDTVNGLWKLGLNLRQEWNDTRLAFYKSSVDLKKLTLTNPKLIWTPDIYFPEAIETQFNPHVRILISPDGRVIQTSSITLHLICPKLSSGRDSVICPIKIASYAYIAEDVKLSWKENSPIAWNQDDLVLPRSSDGLRLNGVNCTVVEVDLNTGGVYQTAIASFSFGRGNTISCTVDE